MYSEYGLNDFDYVQRPVEFVQFSDNGIYGLIPKLPSDVGRLFDSTNSTVAPFTVAPTFAGHRKRRAITEVPGNSSSIDAVSINGIPSPIVCIEVNKAVLFKVS